MQEHNVYLYPEEETLRFAQRLPFVCTTTFFNQCAKLKLDPFELIGQVSATRVFLTMWDKNDSLVFLLEQAVLLCAIQMEEGKPEASLIIKYVKKKSVKEQNRFLRQSLKLFTEYGAVLWKGKDIYSGHSWLERDAAKQSFYDFLPKLKEQTNRLGDGNRKISGETSEEAESRDDGDDEFNEFNEFDCLLDIAEFYNLAEDEVQKTAAQSGTETAYILRESVNDYSRVDKVGFAFYVTSLDGKVFKKNVRVQTVLVNGETVTGTIVQLDPEAYPPRIDVWFETKFSVDEMPERGILAPEYNAVQREVREAVIEELRSGTAASQYLENVLGRNHFLPYLNTDLTAAVDRLKSTKYPPNDSQIDAIVRGINVQDALLVLGPPGTGKTTVILEWVKHFVKNEKKRVLISSQNNKAVDNVLERLSQEKGIETIRVGNEEKVQVNVQHLMFENRALELQRRIEKATSEYESKLNNDLEKLTFYKDILTSVKETLIQLDIAEDQLNQTYEALTAKQLPELRSIYKEFLQVQEGIKQHRSSVDSLVVKITKYHNLSKFRKIIELPLRQLRVYNLKKHLSGHEALRQEEAALAQQYNSVYKAVEELVCSDRMTVLKSDWRHLQEQGQKGSQAVRSAPVWESYLPDFEVPENITEQSLDQAVGHCYTVNGKIEQMRAAIQQWKEHLAEKKNYALSQVLLESVDLVGATCIGINSKQRFKDLKFDVTIIDEAGQIQIHNAIVPMSRSSKVIMLGDHLQIPPIEDSEVKLRCEENTVDTSLLSTSLFEYMYKRFPNEHKILLDTQYRMPGEISDVLSAWFYEGQYKAFEGKRGLQSPLLRLCTSPFALISTSDSSRRRETEKTGEGFYNTYEAMLAVEVLKEALQSINPETLNPQGKKYVPGGRSFTPEEIGIITPYNTQVKFLRELVMKELPEISREEANELVASLDSFQGQERPIIIYSCTRSNTIPPHKKRIGFLKELRRLNVALSRCQQQLVLIGDMDFFKSCVYEDETQRDEEGRPKPGTSEKEFAEFIRLLLSQIDKGNGQIILSEKLFPLDVMKG